MIDIISKESEEEPIWPSYSDVGSILLEVISYDSNVEHSWQYHFDIEVHEYDGCAFWINEGVGIDYWINCMIYPDELKEPGFYVIEGIIGNYHRGEWGFTEDEEEFTDFTIRKATKDEINAL